MGLELGNGNDDDGDLWAVAMQIRQLISSGDGQRGAGSIAFALFS